MVGSIRPVLLGLACVAAGAIAAQHTVADEAKPSPKPPAPSAEKDGRSALYAVPGEDPPQAFVPKRPLTVDQRQQIEALRDFSTARALEQNKAWNDAINLLEKALKLEPDSVAILKRLSRLCFVLGKTEQALQYSRRVLETDPGDTDTITRLVNHYIHNNDPAGAVATLKGVLDNRALPAHSPGRLIAESELGKLFSGKLNQPENAAEAFAKVVAGLDEKDANRLSPLDQARILGEEPAEAYLDFGNIFLETRRYDLAIQAFERGLVYSEDHPVIPLRLSEAFLKTGKGAEALQLVDRFLKRQPQGSEGYELLEKVLTALNREAEITPRLEQAAKVDSKNLPLQYALADRFYKTGQVDRAEALYKSLLAAQPTPEGYRALAASLLKRRKADELLRVFSEAVTKPGGFDAVKPQLEAVIKDQALAGELLEAGQKAFANDPNRLDNKAAVTVLAEITNQTGKFDKFIPILRLILKRNPSPLIYREIAHTLSENMRQHAEAAATYEEMLTKYPDERNARTLVVLGEERRQAGKYDTAIESLREALKLEPNNPEAQLILALALNQAGKGEEGIELIRVLLKNDPANPAFNRLYGSLLIQNGKNDAAITHYKGLLEKYPHNDEVSDLAHSGLSVAYVNVGDYAKGESELEVLFQRNPDEPGVNNDLGYLYADQGKNLERAEAMIRKAIQEKPDEAAYLDSLGWVLYKRGKVQEAVEPLEQAVKQLSANGGAGGDATIYEHLGDVYFRLQENAKAKISWEQAEKAALKATPPDKRLPEIRKKLESLSKLAPAPKPAAGNTP